MKKSNKVSFFYALSCLILFVSLAVGGCYGIYLSVGLNFVRSSVSNITDGVNAAPGVQNVSFGGSVNFPSSMIGVIILSVALIILSVFDIISLVRQIVLFKQFKVIRESKLEHKIEKKVKSKGVVIFFAVVIDILSLAAGIAGIIINSRSFARGNFVWVMYAVDALVSIFALISIVLLIVKLRQVKRLGEESEKNRADQYLKTKSEDERTKLRVENTDDINELESTLLKLKHLKSSKLISPEEYDQIRKCFFQSQSSKGESALQTKISEDE